jgi:hypothetical protein
MPALPQDLPPVYPLLGLLVGYALLLFFNPIRLALRDGFRCICRFKRMWLTFVALGLAYGLFKFLTFTLGSGSPFELAQITSVGEWAWPRLAEVWPQTLLPALEGVAGIFDNATTTYPLSAFAAILLLCNWRGLHGTLLVALQKRYRLWSYAIYIVVVLSALAAIFKPIVYWRLPIWRMVMPERALFQTAAAVDAVAFIFEYLVGIYIQVYLITVALAWIKGLSFTEEGLFQFAVRRFSYVLKWAGVVVIVSLLIVRLPLLLAYFINLPGVLDYQPIERYAMSALIIAFATVQISLVLHNENLTHAMRAHWQFIRRNAGRFGWFLLICGVHFFILTALDAIVRNAAGDRTAALLLWSTIYVIARGVVTGWLLAAWVCLFRQCETGRINQETWIQY